MSLSQEISDLGRRDFSGGGAILLSANHVVDEVLGARQRAEAGDRGGREHRLVDVVQLA
jgi:hypothetical protein